MSNIPNTVRGTEERSGSTSFSEQNPQGSAGVADKAREAASSVADKARETAASMSERAGELASDVANKAESTKSAVGHSMKSLADSLRDHAPSSGMLKSATSSAADALESSGRYLEETRFSGLGHDFTNLVRRNPIPAVLIGIGFGFLIARAGRR